MVEAAAPAGPVDLAVIGFPGQRRDPAVAAALVDAVATGTIRVLDALVVSKDENDVVTVIDVDDVDDARQLLGFPVDLPGMLTESDATEIGTDLPADTSALLIAWENVWAVRIRRAVAAAGGVVALHERLDAAGVAGAVEELSTTKEE